MLSPTFDVVAAHRHFAAACFNGVWELLERTERTSEDDLRMIAMVQASLHHWYQRTDCTPQNLSVGYWQVSRVYVVAGNSVEAVRYGQLSLEAARNEPPFFIGYAHEALARAAKVAGDAESQRLHVVESRRCAKLIADSDERAILEKDLRELG